MSYALALAFDTDETDFVRGFEAGCVWEQTARFAADETATNMLSEAGELFLIVHATNAEMMLRIAEKRGLDVRSEEIGDGWLNVYFTHGTQQA